MELSNSTHNLSSNSSDLLALTLTEKWALSILVTVVSFFGTIGNLLAIICILNQDINTSVSDNPTNLLLLSQAVVDLSVSCVAGPGYCYTLYNPRADSIAMIIGELTGTASIGNLALLTLNQFASMYFSLTYPRIVTPSRTKVAITLNWAICLMWGFLNDVGLRKNVRQIAGILMFHITASILIIVGCYVYIYKKARYHKKEIKRVSYHLTAHQAGLQKDLRSVFSLLLVSGTFFVTWAPLMIVSFVYKIEENRKGFRRILSFLLPLVYLNSALDPVIYYIRSPKFRRALHRLERRYIERRIGSHKENIKHPFVKYRKKDGQMSF